jgi:hypothetical protein
MFALVSVICGLAPDASRRLPPGGERILEGKMPAPSASEALKHAYGDSRSSQGIGWS